MFSSAAPSAWGVGISDRKAACDCRGLQVQQLLSKVFLNNKSEPEHYHSA